MEIADKYKGKGSCVIVRGTFGIGPLFCHEGSDLATMLRGRGYVEKDIIFIYQNVNKSAEVKLREKLGPFGSRVSRVASFDDYLAI